MLNINKTVSDEESGSSPAAARRAAGSASEESPATLVDEIMAEMAAMRATEQKGHFGGWVRKSVSMAHLHVLAVLEAEGSRSVGRIARELDVSLASATGIVSRMEERGLVRRARDPRDRRVVLVELTEAGSEVRAEIGRRGAAHLRRLLQEVDEADLRHFLIGLRALRAVRARLAAADRPGPSEEVTASQPTIDDATPAPVSTEPQA